MHKGYRILKVTSSFLLLSVASCTEVPKPPPQPISVKQKGAHSEVTLCGIKVRTKIDNPDSSLSPHLKELPGIWGNTGWEATPNAPYWDQMCTALIIEQIDPEGRMQVVYVIGDTPRWQIKGGWKRHQTQLIGDRFVIYIRGGTIPATYVLNNNQLNAYVESGWALRAYPQKLPIQVTKAP